MVWGCSGCLGAWCGAILRTPVTGRSHSSIPIMLSIFGNPTDGAWHSSIRSFIFFIRLTCHVPSPVLGAEDATVKQTKTSPCHGADIQRDVWFTGQSEGMEKWEGTGKGGRSETLSRSLRGPTEKVTSEARCGAAEGAIIAGIWEKSIQARRTAKTKQQQTKEK